MTIGLADVARDLLQDYDARPGRRRSATTDLRCDAMTTSRWYAPIRRCSFRASVRGADGKYYCTVHGREHKK